MSQHKCEVCGTEIQWSTKTQRGRVARGWTGSGSSKWGNDYDKNGIAWFCPGPRCQFEKNKTDLRNLLPCLTDEQIKILAEQTGMDNLRKN